MKRLAPLLFAGLLTISSASAFEKDLYKYIPQGTNVWVYDFEFTYAYFWDKNNNGKAEIDEVFFDFNKDGIPDISFREIYDNYVTFQLPKNNVYAIKEVEGYGG